MSSLPPRQSRSRASDSTGRPRRKSGKQKSSGAPVALIAIVAVVLIAGVAILYQTVIGPQFAGGGDGDGGGLLDLAGIGSDSSDEIVGDYLNVMQEFASVVDGVRDAPTAESAIPELQKLESELLQIQRRAVLVKTSTPEEYQELQKTFDPEVKQLVDRFKQGAGRLSSLGLQQTEFAFVLQETVSAQSMTGHVIDRVHQVVPEPKDEFESIARDYAMLQCERERIIARIDSEAKVAVATTELKELASRIEDVNDRKRALPGNMNSRMGLLSAKWLEYTGYGVNTIALVSKLEAQFGQLDELRSADIDVSTAASNYGFAGGPGDTSAYRTASTDQDPNVPSANQERRPPESIAADPSNRFGGPGGLPGRPGGVYGGRQGRPLDPGSSGIPPNASVTIILEGGPFTNPRELGLKGEEFFAKSQERTEAGKKFAEQLGILTGTTSRHTNITGNTAVNLIGYSGDIQELADKINFGKVTKVDTEARSISVDMSDVE